MKEVPSTILIYRSIKQKDLHGNIREKIFQHLLNIERGYAREKRAEELIKIIDAAKTEEEILSALEKMEKQQEE